jgi:hypothetical protein
MTADSIVFQTSVWNRAEHLGLLLENLAEVYTQDRRFELAISFFESDDISTEAARRMVTNTPFRSWFLPMQGEFNNGAGHNAAARLPGPGVIICAITADLRMPANICSRIRACTVAEERFYGPKVLCEDKDGVVHRCEHAYSLISVYADDFRRAGGFRENVKWGGDNDEKPEGGEDKVLCQELKKLNLVEMRPYEKDLVCRWHRRDRRIKFYSSLNRYKKKPWWTFEGE